MFEAAEVGHSLSKKEFKQVEPEIHESLLRLQRQLRKSERSLVILVSGVEGAGKGEVVDRLNRWFDTRDVQTHAFWNESDEERERPLFWRYWRALPARKSIGVMFGSWYTKPIVEHAISGMSDGEFGMQMRKIEELERSLSRDGTIIVKLWFHLSKEQQQHRLKADLSISQFKKPPNLEQYSRSFDTFIRVSEKALRLTDSGFAPWHIIEANDRRYRDASVGQILISTLENQLKPKEKIENGAVVGEDLAHAQLDSVLNKRSASSTVLDTVDMDKSVEGEVYKTRVVKLQDHLHELAWEMHHRKKNAVMLFEGWDAGGKGSAIRRITSAIDARLYRVIPIAAPTDEELAHHYLWRFWRHIPRAGYLSIYDRSWYGRVLVERVEGFAEQKEWLRSYQEINNFEEHLYDAGVSLMKFWIHISPEEQLARFKAREQDPRKQHKITDEDWRNREKWDDYKLAVNDMVAHTSTTNAPWTIVAGNDKKFARLQILETVCERLQSALEKG